MNIACHFAEEVAYEANVANQKLECDSCGALVCDPSDRCGCGKLVCPHCSDNPQLHHLQGEKHLLLKDVFAREIEREVKFPSVGNLGVHNASYALLVGLSLLKLADRTAKFQRSRFPNQPIAAKAKHLKKEAGELADAPEDIVENADCLLLTLGINAENNRDVAALLQAAHEKLTVCEGREWGPADEDGVHHHIEEAR